MSGRVQVERYMHFPTIVQKGSEATDSCSESFCGHMSEVRLLQLTAYSKAAVALNTGSRDLKAKCEGNEVNDDEDCVKQQ